MTLIWKKISPRTTSLEAIDGEGDFWNCAEWQITNPEKRATGPFYLKYRRPIPEGQTYEDIRDLMLSVGTGNSEWHRLHAYHSAKEVGYTYTEEWAKELAERLCGSYEGLPDVKTILLEKFKRYPGERNWFVYDMPKGSMSVTLGKSPEQYIRVTYDPKNATHWHNVLSIQGDSYSYDQTFLIPSSFPKKCDPLRVAARFLVDEILPWFINNRVPRSH